MKKLIMSITIVGIMLLTLTGCGTTKKAYTYNVETGDAIEVELTMNGGYDITSDIPFVISKDGKNLSQGSFITDAGYNQYISLVNNDSNSRIIESTTKNGLQYTFYTYNNTEWNYIIKIVNSNSGLLLGNNISEESARDCFERLVITKK